MNVACGPSVASEPAADIIQDAENAESWTNSGFMQFYDGSLDHLTAADDRVELDLFDDGRWLIAAETQCTHT